MNDLDDQDIGNKCEISEQEDEDDEEVCEDEKLDVEEVVNNYNQTNKSSTGSNISNEEENY